MKPEEKARQEIDRQLRECGWQVQDHKSINIAAGLGVAVREFPLKSGDADYLLYADGKAIGVIEAKPEGHTLTGVELQSSKYTLGLPDELLRHKFPLPFAYESTGVVTRFTNGLDPLPRSREVFTFFRPEELLRLVKLENQLRTNLAKIPALKKGRLWPVQFEAVRQLELSLAESRPRALIQMATGSGKTYVASTFAFRLIKYARAKRILFLVDRNNLGKQAFGEFSQYASPESEYKFGEEFNMQRLTSNTIDPVSRVSITTIQRLYSILKGEEEFQEENEDTSMFESTAPIRTEPAPVVYNPIIPPEFFDFIVVDECHRSIYNVWRQVLEYFDGFIIGLTATPSNQTIGFFKENVVQTYSHEKAVADGVNVGYSIYRIETRITKEGARLDKEPGVFVPRRDKRTLKRRLTELDEDLTYTAGQLDRDVVNESQMRLVIGTFRDRLQEIFPGRTEVPKTLVFAKTDLHADDIVKVFREEFAKGNDFCQKITSKTTGKKPEDLLSEFRNTYQPRVAVTVDMIATGTDIKPLECIFFMRNVKSASYFEQMKGRGVRIIGIDDLLRVTPDARSKTHFVIVDAVGVTENDKTHSKPLDRTPSVSLDKLLQLAAQGMVSGDLASSLASRLSQLQHQLSGEQLREIEAAAGEVPLSTLANDLLESIDPDINSREATEVFGVSDDAEPTEQQVAEIERKRISNALSPFYDPELREILTTISTSLEQLIDEQNLDLLLRAEFSDMDRTKARTLIEDFRQFIQDNKDEIEALKIMYSKPYRARLRYEDVKELAKALERPPLEISRPELRLWRAHEAAEPEKVKGRGGTHLVDLVALVRHAIHPDTPLFPIRMGVEARYQEWLVEQEASGIEFTEDQRKWLDAIKDHIATSLRIERDEFEYPPFHQLGGLGKAYILFGEQLPNLLGELNGKLAA